MKGGLRWENPEGGAHQHTSKALYPIQPITLDFPLLATILVVNPNREVEMKVGDLVVISGATNPAWVGFPARVVEYDPNDDGPKLTPLRVRPDRDSLTFPGANDGRGYDFWWPRNKLKLARKVVHLRKTFKAAGIRICLVMEPVLERLGTVDAAVAWVNEDPEAFCGISRRRVHARWALVELRKVTGTSYYRAVLGLDQKGPLQDDEAAEFKQRLELLSDKLGCTEYVPC